MFTGFASENTPAIQVWDFFQSLASASALRSVTLTDDCAPIQYFRTGGTASQPICVYLPTAPIDGKRITIVNVAVGSARQFISLFTSDVTTNSGSTGTQSVLLSIGQGQTVDLCYFSRVVGANGVTPVSGNTGWISLNQMAAGASNNSAVSLGGSANAATATFAAVLGGTSNTASGSYATVVGGQTNTASQTGSVVIGGASSSASQTNSIVVGGSSNTAGGNASVVAGGQFLNASGTGAGIFGGTNHSASGDRSAIIGGAVGTTRSIVGNFVTPASYFPVAGQSGVQQLATLLLGRPTTDATATVLSSNNVGAFTTNQVILPNNSAYYFRGSVIANVTGGGDTKAWTFDGAIKRGANAASTTIVGSTVTSMYADAGATTWIITVTADTTNGGLAVTVTGQAATTIRWVCKIETTEVTY